MLTLGGLPPGVSNGGITWVPVRVYSSGNEGGFDGEPGETYPYSWEGALDAVYLDGQMLPGSILGDSANVSLTALIDTVSVISY